MDILKKLMTPLTGHYFGSNFKDLWAFGKSIGEAKLYNKGIYYKKYPHIASVYAKTGFVPAVDVQAVYLEGCDLSFLANGEIMFLHHDLKEKLKIFAEMNAIPVSIRNSNWSHITEPFLDTAFSEESTQRTIDLLVSRGFTQEEVLGLRNLIEKQMMKYNFDTQLWEWRDLGLHDVLLAMRPVLAKKDVQAFYHKAIEIELRAK